jgi:hypothetical protein
MKKRKPGRTSVTGGRTVFETWSRFSYERTPKRKREWLYDRRENHISCSVLAPCSNSDVLSAICEKARHTVPIELFSPQLRTPVLPRGRVVFGSAWEAIDEIASNYTNMQWWISEYGLTMDIVFPPLPPQDFDQIAGKLVFEMRQKFPNSRLSRERYLEIGAQLENFDVRNLLPKGPREELAAWNQRNGKGAIRTFSQAIAVKQPRWLSRQTIRRLYRAHEKFKRRQTLLYPNP